MLVKLNWPSNALVKRRKVVRSHSSAPMIRLVSLSELPKEAVFICKVVKSLDGESFDYYYFNEILMFYLGYSKVRDLTNDELRGRIEINKEWKK